VETLCSLAGEFPAEFLRNPIVPLLNLTQPDFVYRLPLSLWQYLLRDEKIPMAWVRQIQRKSPSFYLHQRQAILDLIQRHVAIGGEVPTPWHKQTVIEQIKKHIQPNQVPAFEENADERLLFALLTLLLPQTVSMLKETLNHFLYHEPEQGLLLLNACRNLSPRNLAHLAQKPSLALRCLIARHPQTPKRTLFMLSVQLAPEVRSALASNSRMPLPILQRLATDPEVAVRCIVAHHPNLAPESIQGMALDKEESVRTAIAKRPRLDAALLQQLAQDQSSLVRAAVARNTQLSIELLAKLADDPETLVQAAAGNTHLPYDIQATLLSSSDELIRARLAANTRLQESLFARLVVDPSLKVRCALAANPKTPPTLLEVLWQNATLEVYQGLARNPKTPAEWLKMMVEQQDLSLQVALARHKRTPEAALYTLAIANQRPIWQALASNPCVPLELLELAVDTTPLMLEPGSLELWIRILNHPTRPRQQALLKVFAACIQRFLERPNGLPGWFRRVYWQYSSSFPVQIMQTMASSPHWEERYLVASHPRISSELRDRLAHDGNRYVQAAARVLRG
jgi:Leucine rich repeat variant